MSDVADLVGGIVTRAIQFAVKQFLPELESAIASGPLGLLLKAALATDWVKNLEAQLAGKLGSITSQELAKLEADCATWATSFLSTHPDAKAFFLAIRPPAPIEFDTAPDVADAIKAAIADGTIRAKLGLS